MTQSRITLSQCKFYISIKISFYRKEKVKETVVSYVSRSDVDKILIEATANENWNIQNSKLQVLADAAYQQ